MLSGLLRGIVLYEHGHHANDFYRSSGDEGGDEPVISYSVDVRRLVGGQRRAWVPTTWRTWMNCHAYILAV